MKPIAYFNISTTQLSIARYYGGMNVNGVLYVYIAQHDILIHSKHAKYYQKGNYEAFLEYVNLNNNQTK